MKLSGSVHCTKMLSEFEWQGQRSKAKGQGHRGQKKNEKVRYFVRESSSGGAVYYAGGKISACCLLPMSVQSNIQEVRLSQKDRATHYVG